MRAHVRALPLLCEVQVAPGPCRGSLSVSHLSAFGKKFIVIVVVVTIVIFVVAVLSETSCGLSNGPCPCASLYMHR